MATKKKYKVAVLPMHERDEKTGKVVKSYEVGDPIELNAEKAAYHLKHGWVVELGKEDKEPQKENK